MNELTLKQTDQINETQLTQPLNEIGVFGSGVQINNYIHAAEYLAKSNVVPKQYQNNPANCLVAIDMSIRMGMNPLAVMQNLYVVYGMPAWSGQFFISCINKSGLFSRLRFEMTDLPDFEANDKNANKKITLKNKQCRAFAVELSTGQTIYGPPVTVQMAVQEGWYFKDGSKWKTNPDLMLTYRSASFFGKTYCPEITMGIHTADEAIDSYEKNESTKDILDFGQNKEKIENTVQKQNLLEELKNVKTSQELKNIGIKIGASSLNDSDREELREEYKKKNDSLNAMSKTQTKESTKESLKQKQQSTLIKSVYDEFVERSNDTKTYEDIQKLALEIQTSRRDDVITQEEYESLVKLVETKANQL